MEIRDIAFFALILALIWLPGVCLGELLPPKTNSLESRFSSELLSRKVRFVRIQYAGGDWDQDMGKGADYNLLLKLQKYCGCQIADETESIKLDNLKSIPEDQLPAFLYITGKGRIKLSDNEIANLRWFLTRQNGVLFADHGGGRFDLSFKELMKALFPKKELEYIAVDDFIMRTPFHFATGAPPLWHHAGNYAKGIRNQQRWMVFYHPGDMNDAWKGLKPMNKLELQEDAFRMAVNVINYAYVVKYHAKSQLVPPPQAQLVFQENGLNDNIGFNSSRNSNPNQAANTPKTLWVPKVIRELNETSDERPDDSSIKNLDDDFEKQDLK